MANASDVRILFVSDIHLGTPDAQASLLRYLLRQTRPERVYLVGDVFDLIAMKHRAVLDSAQQALVRHILRMARTGCEVIYIPGNHDAAFRTFCGQKFHNVRIERDVIHETRDGRRLLISHGDEFDGHFDGPRWKLIIGEMLLKSMRRINRWTVRLRRRLGRPYWSLSGAAKRRSGNVRDFAAAFRASALSRAKHEQVDGYVGGHIHIPGFELREGLLYCNDGDWVEHCTALAEGSDGRLRLIDWHGNTLVDDPCPPTGVREHTEAESWLGEQRLEEEAVTDESRER
ncbi:UDP-2,3-diacylglucosamine diphosphatase [Kushneria phosphatilytica]|uniref:UDP-2,3-diacylglucosamine diphosphatase n=1 Tax=Kushneria phosphatilytica TaxID=657387 RepID=A0A1S1NVZ0_9GAMM|nr:UDP-2,3-diacylglucosamine diphosphatase [Kushneria phosphatilytica]OHV09336.1 UDP-2,3-diacylglucosamine hydrolase [Kushneria phosphatilytica]QEL12298.1 UDP-2,3-diacylglucosamine diphosphatase [Kushneria phosphatilytica]